MIKVAVFDSALKVISKDQINTGAENYYEVSFIFNETWDSYAKYAVFYQVANQPKLEIELSNENQNGEYIVRLPNQLLLVDIPIYVGAYGSKTQNDEDVIICTNFKALPVAQGAFGDNLIAIDNASLSIVRSTDTKIRLIRENENGQFEYTTDGENWKEIANKLDIEILDNLEEAISLAQNALPKTGGTVIGTLNFSVPNDNSEPALAFNNGNEEWVITPIQGQLSILNKNTQSDTFTPQLSILSTGVQVHNNLTTNTLRIKDTGQTLSILNAVSNNIDILSVNANGIVGNISSKSIASGLTCTSEEIPAEAVVGSYVYKIIKNI